MIGESSTIVKGSQSSLILQILVFFSAHYTAFFFLINLCLFTYKGQSLFNEKLNIPHTTTFEAARYYYPGRYLGWDIVTIFLFVIVDGTRLLLRMFTSMSSQSIHNSSTIVSKGNKTLQISPLVLSILLAMPLFVLHAYYIDLQTYV